MDIYGTTRKKKNYLLITFTGMGGVSCLFFGMVLNGQFGEFWVLVFPLGGTI